MSNIDYALQERRTELGKHLKQYLEQNGVKVSSSNQMSCWLGLHKDDNPSMTLMKPDYNRAYCYSCLNTADIFDAANILENKPLEGKGFITENVNYLSKLFGYPPLDIELTQEDERELKAERIYRVAASLFRKRLNIEHAKSRGWFDQDLCRTYGVGTIENVDDFVQAIMKTAKVTKQDLEDVCFETRWFGPNKLTFVIANPRGECIGFVSRNMKYEELKKSNSNVQKYLNPVHASPLYDKSKFIYNLHKAKHSKSVILTEGYAEIITGASLGIENIAAWGATGTLNEAKVEQLIRTGVKKVILAGGYDFKKKENADGTTSIHRAAQDGMLKNLKVFRNYPQITVYILDFTKYLNEYLEKFPDADKVGLDEYMLALDKAKVLDLIENPMSGIEYTIKEHKERGINNPKEIANIVIEMIAHEYDPLAIPDHILTLSNAVGIDVEFITEAVKKQRRLLDEQNRKEALKIVSEFTKKSQSAKSTPEMIDLAADMTRKLDRADPRNLEFNNEIANNWVQKLEEQTWDAQHRKYYKTGLHFLDEDMGGEYSPTTNMVEGGGIPHGQGYLVFPGDSQAGKSMSVQKLTHGLLKYNEDLEIIVMACDDGKAGWLYRLWCLETGIIPIHKCRNPLKYYDLNLDQENVNILKAAQKKTASYIEQNRLILKDSSFGSNVSSLRKLIDIHKNKSDRPVVCVLDGIHKLAGSSDQGVLESYSNEIKIMSQEYEMAFVVTTELRKRQQETGFTFLSEPTCEDIKGTRQIEYDADAIYIMDNPVKRMEERKDALTKKGEPYPCYKDYPNTYWKPDPENRPGYHQPVLWVHRPKNKLINEEATARKYYSKFNPPIMEFNYYEPEFRPEFIKMELK